MNTITLTLCASTRTGCLSAAIPACAEVSLTLAGDTSLSAGTSVALLTPRGNTLAHTILSEECAPGATIPLSTLTEQAAEYTHSCRAGDTREALLAIGDSEHPLALVPARIAQNPLYTLAPPTAQAPAYPTSETLHALLAEIQAAALRAENAAAAVDAPALKAALDKNAAAISAEATERAETDQAITQAVNAQASVLEQHQSHLSTLATNYNNLAASYAQSVTDLQKKDAQLETAISSKAPATHTHAISDTTGLQAALEALAPLSSVTTTTNAISSLAERVAALESALTATIDGQTYRLQWSSTAGTFELVARE